MSMMPVMQMIGFVKQLSSEGRYLDAFMLVIKVLLGGFCQVVQYALTTPTDYKVITSGGASSSGHGHSHGGGAPERVSTFVISELTPSDTSRLFSRGRLRSVSLFR